MNPKVDEFLSNAKRWRAEMEQLRRILLDCMLTEELKWRQPCYTLKGKNIAIIGGFKDYCVLSFFKGVLLNDTNNILIKQGENSQSFRVIKFTTTQEIIELEPLLKSYIFEAIQVEKAGLKVDFKSNSEIEIIEELEQIFKTNTSLKTAFEALTPGRQRGYTMFFSAAKQSKTRIARIEKYTERILDGKGLNDCTCGFSKKPPQCDGSHKYL